jgi:hypothetical protein
MSEGIFKYKGHEIVFSGTDYSDVRDSDKCRLCGCSWSAAEMLSECEGVSMSEEVITCRTCIKSWIEPNLNFCNYSGMDAVDEVVMERSWETGQPAPRNCPRNEEV